MAANAPSHGLYREMRLLEDLEFLNLAERDLNLAGVQGGGQGGRSGPRPSIRSVANRLRHFVTVGGEIPSSATISALRRPSAASSTIRERSANAGELVRRRGQRHKQLPLLIGGLDQHGRRTKHRPSRRNQQRASASAR